MKFAVSFILSTAVAFGFCQSLAAEALSCSSALQVSLSRSDVHHVLDFLGAVKTQTPGGFRGIADMLFHMRDKKQTALDQVEFRHRVEAEWQRLERYEMPFSYWLIFAHQHFKFTPGIESLIAEPLAKLNVANRAKENFKLLEAADERLLLVALANPNFRYGLTLSPEMVQTLTGLALSAAFEGGFPITEVALLLIKASLGDRASQIASVGLDVASLAKSGAGLKMLTEKISSAVVLNLNQRALSH